MLDRPMQYYLANQRLIDRVDNPYIRVVIIHNKKRFKGFLNIETGDYIVEGIKFNYRTSM